MSDPPPVLPAPTTDRAPINRSLTLPVGVAAALALVALVARWRGGDLSTQLYRIELFHRAGFTIWNGQWYGGHHTPAYSLLVPPLGAVLGTGWLGFISAVLAAGSFHILIEKAFPLADHRRIELASTLFAAGTLVNLVIGRIPFALGMGLGLAALALAVWNRSVLACVLAVLTALASPVAAAFLGLGLGAWWLVGRRWLPMAMAISCAVPIVVFTLLFPEGGQFTFPILGFLATIGSCVLAWWALPSSARVFRAGIALYVLMSVAAYAISSPLGANVVRLGMFVIAPVIVVLSTKRLALYVGVPLLLLWQWVPAMGDMISSTRDLSTQAAYYRDVVDYLQRNGGGLARVEIPFTARHYETVYVAPQIPLARGWERQLDRKFNTLFYDNTLDPTTFHQWLLDTGVTYVALPDTELDGSAKDEAAMIRGGLPYLAPVFKNVHWQVWRVTDGQGLIDGPGHVIDYTPEQVDVTVTAAADVTIRVRWSPYWALDGKGCLAVTSGDWVKVVGAEPGPLRLYIKLRAPWQDQASACPEP